MGSLLVRWTGSRRPGHHLTLGREPLALETLTVDARGVPRCRVKDARFAARLDRAATYQLLQQVEPGDGSRPAALVLGGRRYPVPGL